MHQHPPKIPPIQRTEPTARPYLSDRGRTSVNVSNFG